MSQNKAAARKNCVTSFPRARAASSDDRCVREDHYAKDLFRTGEEEEEEVNYGE